MAKYKFTLIGYSGPQLTKIIDTKECFGITDKKWDTIDGEEKLKMLDEEWKNWSSEYIDGVWVEI